MNITESRKPGPLISMGRETGIFFEKTSEKAGFYDWMTAAYLKWHGRRYGLKTSDLDVDLLLEKVELGLEVRRTIQKPEIIFRVE